VEKFDGMIDFISKYNKGTTFFFTFSLLPFNSESHFAKEKTKSIRKALELEESAAVPIVLKRMPQIKSVSYMQQHGIL